MPSDRILSVTVAWCVVPRRIDAEGFCELVRASGGRVWGLRHLPEVSFATASGIDPNTLSLLASIAPQEPCFPN